MSERLAAMMDARRRSDAVKALRGLRGPGTALSPQAAEAAAPKPKRHVEHCDLCGVEVPEEHRHMINLVERWILCACETCMALRSGDADLRPTGVRTLWLEDFDLPGEIWSAFQIPVGLAFFLRSSSVGRVVAMYPSPAGATECELELSQWNRLVELNPVLEQLEPDAEALLVNRMKEPHVHVIAPIDECYKLVGMIKANWEGISGGDALEKAVPRFFDGLRRHSKV